MFSQERYREALVKWIVLSNQPFSEPEVETFLEMIKTLNPEAKTICKETVKRDIMKKFQEVVNEIKSKLNKSPAKFSFTMDAWTSKNMLPFLAIRAHWMNANFEYETVLLDFCHITGKHDGPKFCSIFLDCLKRFDIPLSKVLGVTVDNVSSNDTLMSSLETHGIKVGSHLSSQDNRVRCMPHILNLSVQDILEKLKIPKNEAKDLYEHLDEEVGFPLIIKNNLYWKYMFKVDDDSNEVEGAEEEEVEKSDDDDSEDEEENANESGSFTVPKLRTLIKKIRKSTQMRQKLKKFCRLYKIESRVPIIDVATRWNSTFQMIERAAYLKAPLRGLCSNEKKLHKYIMNEREWAELNILQKLLQKFHRATLLMSMERHPTICSYLPTLNWLLESLETFIEEHPGSLAQAAKNGLMKLKKYDDQLKMKSSNIPYIAIFLNPSLKMSYFKEHGYSKPELREIQKSISDMFEKTYGAQPMSRVNENTDESLSDEFLEHMHKRTANREPKEFQKYLHFPLSNAKVNVLEYWKAQKEEFPNLTNMAQDYLAVQSSSVAVERDFASGVDLVTPTRSSLHPETIRACMCLKSYFKNLNSKSHQESERTVSNDS